MLYIKFIIPILNCSHYLTLCYIIKFYFFINYILKTMKLYLYNLKLLKLNLYILKICNFKKSLKTSFPLQQFH